MDTKSERKFLFLPFLFVFILCEDVIRMELRNVQIV